MGWNSEFQPGTDPVDIAILECLRELKAGGIDAFGGKYINVLDGYCDPETGEPVLIVVTTICADDGTSTTTMETIPMATLTPAVPSSADNTFGETQVKFKVRDAQADTAGVIIGGELEGLTIANPVNPELEATPVTLDMICDYDVTALPCKAICLEDPLDPESGVEVAADGSYLDAVQIRSDGDPAKGGVDLDAPFSQIEGGVSVWCATFRAEFDKNGVLVGGGEG